MHPDSRCPFTKRVESASSSSATAKTTAPLLFQNMFPRIGFIVFFSKNGIDFKFHIVPELSNLIDTYPLFAKPYQLTKMLNLKE